MNEAADNVDAPGVRQPVEAAGEAALSWLRDNKRRLKPFALGLALTIFCGGIFLSLRATPDIWARIQVVPLFVILFFTAPASLAVSAVDFQMLARLSGAKVRFWRAAEVTVYTRAANLLPIPGSMAVRMTVLKASGVTFVRSGAVMVLFTAMWGGVGFLFSSVWLLLQGVYGFGGLFAVVGVAILGVSTVAARRAKLNLPDVLAVAGLRLALIMLEALALLMAVQAFGVDAHYQQTAILVVASFLANITQIGLGLREAILAALAPLAGIDPATGFLAGAVARGAGLAFLGAIAVAGYGVSWRNAKKAREQDCE